MSVSEKDVRQVAELARLAIDPGRLPSLVAELNGILAHMEELNAVETGDGTQETGADATPLRADSGTPVPLAIPREEMAPLSRDGFFLVPRLATHEDPAEQGT